MNSSVGADRPLFSQRLVRTVLLVALAAFVVFSLGWLYAELLTIFAGVLLGVFLDGLARALVRRIPRFSHSGAVGALVVLLLVLTALSVWLVGPALTGQLEQLLVQLPAATTKVMSTARSVPLVHSFVAGGEPRVAAVVNFAANTLQVSFEVLAGVVLAVVIGIYAAADPDVYERAALKLVAPARRERAKQVIEHTTSTLMRWLVGQVVVMIVVGALVAIGLMIAGVPLALALGLLAGVMTFVPYLGVVLSMVPALLVALSKSPIEMLWVVVVFVVAHGTEGYVLSPLIARRTVSFPPAFTIGVQILIGAVWGILGFMFATPIAVVATILIQMLYVEDVLGDRA